MALLVMQVAVSGELVEVFEMTVDDVDGHRMLAAANEDERGGSSVGTGTRRR
jgi:hypothetical protein